MWRQSSVAPLLMAVVNTTPDSFSDGGLHLDPAAAAARAAECVRQGAAIIDVGAESTRPGSESVPAPEQIRRAIPAIEAIRGAVPAGTPISVDTTLADVARAALDAGASIINDTSAGRDDDSMLALAAGRRCGLVLMHRLRRPRDDSYSDRYAQAPRYADVVEDVRAFLIERAEHAMDAGVSRESIAIDPGLGFGKSVEQNRELLARLGEIAATGFPVLIGASRKSFVGALAGERSDAPPADRLAGSLAAAIVAAANGAAIIRVHDVSAHRSALAVAAACRGAYDVASPNPTRTAP